MEVIDILREVSKKIYENVKDLAGTEDAPEILEEVQVEIFLAISILLLKKQYLTI